MRVGGVIGYVKLPSHTREGSHADYARSATQDARASMQQIIRNFGKVIQNVRNVTPDALVEALTPTFEKSKVYCPKDTHKLVLSGHIKVDSYDRRPRVRIIYGDKGDPHYAAIVHERTDLHHEAPTRSKWLQAAMEEDIGLFKSRVVAAMKSRGAP